MTLNIARKLQRVECGLTSFSVRQVPFHLNLGDSFFSRVQARR